MIISVGTYSWVSTDLVWKTQRGEEIAVRWGQELEVRPHDRPGWLRVRAVQPGGEVGEIVLSEYEWTRAVRAGKIRAQAVRCPHCGKREDHVGMQYYPMERECRSL